MSGLTFFSDDTVNLPPSTSVMLERAFQLTDVTRHAHDFIEVAFVAKGSSLHTHFDRAGHPRSNCLIQGDVFSVQLGEQHLFEHAKDFVLYNIFIRPAFLDKYPELRSCPGWQGFFGPRENVPSTITHLSASMRHHGIQALDLALNEKLRCQCCHKLLLEGYILDFLVTAMRQPEMKRPALKEDRFCILSAVALMEEHPERHYTLQQLARLSMMSVPTFTQKFRTALGISPMRYLQRARLSQVQTLLAETSLTIEEIALKTGFCNANYLIKIYHRELGVTPAQSRARLNADQQL